LPSHDPVRPADGDRSAEHVAVDDDHRRSGLGLAAQLRGLGAEHRPAVHPHVDPVGHEDGDRPEPDFGVDGGDMLADDRLLHFQVAVTKHGADRHVRGNHPGALARLVAEHRGDLDRSRHEVTFGQRGKIGGQAGQLAKGARGQRGVASLGVFVQAEPPLGAGRGKCLKGLLTVGVRSTQRAVPLLPVFTARIQGQPLRLLARPQRVRNLADCRRSYCRASRGAASWHIA
jgi:hypothetical protein